jgi:hypothetical protein
MQANTSRNPLDVLVISQLTALRAQEAALQDEVKRGTPRNLSSELRQLRDKAERLNRMLDAMSVGGAVWSQPITQPVAA